MYKYCVAQVNTFGNKHEVSFYAFEEGQYGLHRVSDWNEPTVLWYDTQEEAMKHRCNANDCVLNKFFE